MDDTTATPRRSAAVAPNSAGDRITNLANQTASGAADVFVGVGYGVRRTWGSRGLWLFGFSCAACGFPVVVTWLLTNGGNLGKGVAAGISRTPVAHESAWVQGGAALGATGRAILSGAGAFTIEASESIATTFVSAPERPQTPVPNRRTYRPNQNTQTIPIVQSR